MVVALLPPHRADPVRQHTPEAPAGSRGRPHPSEPKPSLLQRVTQQRKLLLRVAIGALISIGLVGAVVSKVVNGSSGTGAKSVSVLNALPRVASTSAIANQREDPVPVSRADRSSPPANSSSVTPTTIATTMVVHAAGAVVVPGVYIFAPGARVADLVAAAGGPSADADTDRLNLAAALSDGSRVFVPRRNQQVPPLLVIDLDTAASADPGASSEGPSSAGKAGSNGGQIANVNLNTATLDQLDSLPGVGPATATAIIEHRTKIGRFRSVTQLMDIPGIGEAKFAAMRARVTV